MKKDRVLWADDEIELLKPHMLFLREKGYEVTPVISVLDVIHAFSKACGRELPYVIDPRRPGDIAECWADPSKAERELGWKAEYGIDEMCRDSWNWQSKNPDGYKTAR